MDQKDMTEGESGRRFVLDTRMSKKKKKINWECIVKLSSKNNRSCFTVWAPPSLLYFPFSTVLIGRPCWDTWLVVVTWTSTLRYKGQPSEDAEKFGAFSTGRQGISLAFSPFSVSEQQTWADKLFIRNSWPGAAELNFHEDSWPLVPATEQTWDNRD